MTSGRHAQGQTGGYKSAAAEDGEMRAYVAT
jgi:hypothetical protein